MLSHLVCVCEGAKYVDASGTGTIKRSADGVVVSIKTTRVGNKDAAMFYGENMQLKRAGKK